MWWLFKTISFKERNDIKNWVLFYSFINITFKHTWKDAFCIKLCNIWQFSLWVFSPNNKWKKRINFPFGWSEGSKSCRAIQTYKQLKANEGCKCIEKKCAAWALRCAVGITISKMPTWLEFYKVCKGSVILFLPSLLYENS